LWIQFGELIMSAEPSKPASQPEAGDTEPPEGTTMYTPGKPGQKMHTVTFGTTTVTGPVPDPADVERSVRESQEALARFAAWIVGPKKPVIIPDSVPEYYIDDDHPEKITRKWHGKIDRGDFVAGIFEAADVAPRGGVEPYPHVSKQNK
jgi:hypothetical protein